MPKYFEIKGRVAITGNPMTDAKLLGKFQAEYDALQARFTEAGGTLDMRIATEKEKVATASAPERMDESDNLPSATNLKAHATEAPRLAHRAADAAE